MAKFNGYVSHYQRVCVGLYMQLDHLEVNSCILIPVQQLLTKNFCGPTPVAEVKIVWIDHVGGAKKVGVGDVDDVCEICGVVLMWTMLVT